MRPPDRTLAHHLSTGATLARSLFRALDRADEHRAVDVTDDAIIVDLPGLVEVPPTPPLAAFVRVRGWVDRQVRR